MEKELADHNVRLIAEQLKAAGLPVEPLLAVRERIGSAKEVAIYAPYTARVGRESVSGSLYLERPPARDHFSLDYFSLDLGKDSRALLRENIFMLGTGYDATLREAFNLMHGRSVYREPLFDPERQGYWVSLDPREQWLGFAKLNYERSGFRVEQAITGSALGKLLPPEERVSLAEALKQGDRKALSVEITGVTKKLWAEAVPGIASIRLVDAHGKAVRLPEIAEGKRLEGQVVEHGRGRAR
jgi:hypothetical protein